MRMCHCPASWMRMMTARWMMMQTRISSIAKRKRKRKKKRRRRRSLVLVRVTMMCLRQAH
jgi:hypothetical protein